MSPIGRIHNYDADVKSNIRNAATAQEAYFVDHNTYTSNIESLKAYGYNQSFNVTMGASATETIYIITGTATKGCEPDTGAWYFISTTGTIHTQPIHGTPCSRSR